MYCFKKCKTKARSDSMSYWHPYFVRGQRELLTNIIRKNPRRILKQKEAQLKGLGIELRSSNSTFSKDQEYDESKRTLSKTPSKLQEHLIQANSEQKNSSNSNNIYNYFMQLMGKINTKYDKNAINMIESYLNDDEEDDNIETLESAYGYKKLKYSSEYPLEQNTQYVQMDFNTLAVKPLQSNESQEALNSQLPRTTQVFKGRDYIQCQNLIQNLYEIRSKNVDLHPYGSDSNHSYVQELSSWKTGDFNEEEQLH